MQVFHHCQASLMENFSKLISQVQSLVHVLLQQHLAPMALDRIRGLIKLPLLKIRESKGGIQEHSLGLGF
ncbi:hypothetical protein DsansV1_C04g0037171 [Dioscorea sansibarensis]